MADLGTFDPSGQPVSWTPSVEGYYYVTCAGLEATDFPIAVNTVHFVLPESVFGALAAIGAGIAAFATVKIYQGRTKR